MIITNLFSIFDPSTSSNFSFNWLSLFLFLFLLPVRMWAISNRFFYTISLLKIYIFSEFGPLVKKSPYVLIILIRFFFLILFNNLPGLFPFIFTSTRHIRVTINLAFSLWLGLVLYRVFFNLRNFLIHLIPNGTPFILIPFIVIIETVRNLIRPLTLAIRLAANMIAGHLLISLIMSTNDITPFFLLPLLFLGQLALMFLEIAVAFIQAYVFRVLMTLYSSERVT